MAIENEEWLFAREALALIEPRFEFEGMAERVLLHRLEAGTLKAYQTGAYRYLHHKGFIEEEDIERGDGPIIEGFWWSFRSAMNVSIGGDDLSEAQVFWETGDFSFRFNYADSEAYSGYAHGVVFHRSGIADILGERRVPNFQGGMTTDAPTSFDGPPVPQFVEGATASKRGRPVANWWPDFAEELAVFIHDKGPPETQEALISGIQAAMTAAGKDEPSRTQIQPVIQAVLSRLRPAGI